MQLFYLRISEGSGDGQNTGRGQQLGERTREGRASLELLVGTLASFLADLTPRLLLSLGC